jgi:hypothetical protein
MLLGDFAARSGSSWARRTSLGRGALPLSAVRRMNGEADGRQGLRMLRMRSQLKIGVKQLNLHL